MIGSRRTGLHLSLAAFSAREPATLNAISLESTSWYEPSTIVALTSTSGKPAMTPFFIPSSIPARAGAIYSLGTDPPTTLLSKVLPVPASSGSNSTHT
ncbi:hypothetical protein D3C76_853620 [compost metagenome]